MKTLLHVRHSLAFRIVLPLAIALVAVFAAAAFYLGRTVRDQGLRELRDRAQLLADTLAHHAELPLLAGDLEAVVGLLEGAVRDRDLIEIAVYDAAGHAVATYSPPAPDEPALATPQGAGVLVLESPVHTARDPTAGSEDSAFALDPGAPSELVSIGRVRLQVSMARTSARTRRLHAQIAVVGAGLLVLCVVVGAGIVRIVGRPLRALVDATRLVATGDLSVRVAPAAADEIGELARAFNRMAAELESARAQLLFEHSALESRVAARTAELQRAQETLIHAEKMSAVGQLVAGVAHELNNPLTVVLGYADLLLETTSDAAVRRRLSTIAAAAESSRKIVQNLLAFARKQKPERSATSLNDVIVRTIELRAYHLRTEHVEVETVLDPLLPRTWADGHQIQQVLLNLLVNAEQAIHDSGKGGRIRFTTRSIADRIEIAVEDDGPGMSPEVRARVFEPFFTTKDVGRGTGLGLSICYGIVAEHGGMLRAESEAGHFSRFTIDLPIHEPPDAELAPSREAAVPAAPLRLRLLVIDDDPAILQLVEEAFREQPIVVDTALGGRDGIASLSAGQVYDVILSDMRMPEVDGKAVFQFVREHRPELESRMIFVTGDLANPESVGFMSRAGRPLLEKPFSVEALRTAVRRLWES